MERGDGGRKTPIAPEYDTFTGVRDDRVDGTAWVGFPCDEVPSLRIASEA